MKYTQSYIEPHNDYLQVIRSQSALNCHIFQTARLFLPPRIKCILIDRSSTVKTQHTIQFLSSQEVVYDFKVRAIYLPCSG